MPLTKIDLCVNSPSFDNAACLSTPIPGAAASEGDNTPAEDGVVRPAIPRYYSQLKKAHKERIVPELRKEDIKESFVRGACFGVA